MKIYNTPKPLTEAHLGVQYCHVSFCKTHRCFSDVGGKEVDRIDNSRTKVVLEFYPHARFQDTHCVFECNLGEDTRGGTVRDGSVSQVYADQLHVHAPRLRFMGSVFSSEGVVILRTLPEG